MANVDIKKSINDRFVNEDIMDHWYREYDCEKRVPKDHRHLEDYIMARNKYFHYRDLVNGNS